MIDDSGAERLTPRLPRRFALGLCLGPAMLVLAAATLAVDMGPGVAVIEDHAVQFEGETLTINAGNTLSASSEIVSDVIAYWNQDAAGVFIQVVDGTEALTSAGADAPTDAEVDTAIGSNMDGNTHPWVRLGRVQFSRDAGAVITMDEIVNTVRAYEIETAPKGAGSGFSELDPESGGGIYVYSGELAFEVDAADLADADLVTDYPLPLFHGKIGRLRALATKAITTGAKACDIDAEINAVGVTGGQIELAGAYALGAVEEGTAITALSLFKPGDNLSLIGSSTTTFIEGRVKIVVELYRRVFPSHA